MQGGVGAYSQKLAEGLTALGHEVHIITSRSARADENNRDWRSLKDGQKQEYGILYPVAGKWGWRDVNRMADIAVRHKLQTLNIQYQAAAYNMWLPAINFAPRRINGICPIVVTFHDLRYPYLFPKAGKWRPWVVEQLASQSAGSIATNAEDFSRLKRMSPQTANIPIGSNITVHDTDDAQIADIRRGLNVPADDYLLGYFGFLNPNKGADMLIRALAGCEENVHLVFVGGQTGDSDNATNAKFRTQIKEMINDLKLSHRVHWTGFLPDEQVSAYLKSVDLIVMPYRDGISLRRGTIMAALAHGRPIISTEPNDPNSPFVHGKNCWLVDQGDNSDLMWSIKMALKNAGIRGRLAENALELSKQFSWQAIAQKTADFYQSLI